MGFWGGGLLKCDGNLLNFFSKKPQKVDFWAKKVMGYSNLVVVAV